MLAACALRIDGTGYGTESTELVLRIYSFWALRKNQSTLIKWKVCLPIQSYSSVPPKTLNFINLPVFLYSLDPGSRL